MRLDFHDMGLAFTNPVAALVALRSSEVEPCLREADRQISAGRAVAGYLAYEAGEAFGLAVHQSTDPLLVLGVYDGYEPAAPRQGTVAAMGDIRPAIGEPEYLHRVEAIRSLIATGDTYQTNLTTKVRFRPHADPLAYYFSLLRAHPVPYAAYVDDEERQILSLSPELLLKLNGREIESRPMKGTAQRGLDVDEDRQISEGLARDPKERAENLMIADMMRNDLGRVCVYGSVRTDELFHVERFRTLHQMTSTVKGTLRDYVGMLDIMRATFPAASITGAPKKRTMEIIRNLEREPRGVYTGAIGAWLPDGQAMFNVAIRTITHRDGLWEAGVGSGITWDSDPMAEYEETQLKSTFLLARPPDFHIFETLLLAPDGYAYLKEHLDRMEASAEYWDFPFDRREAEAVLSRYSQGAPKIVRLALDPEGRLSATERCWDTSPPTADLLLIESRTDPADPHRRHKTTRREIYDTGYSLAVESGCWDALFTNRSGNATEGAITSLFYRQGAEWFTPPITDGLLPGIWRAATMRRLHASERSLAVQDLSDCDEILVGSSVRGKSEVRTIHSETAGYFRSNRDSGMGNHPRECNGDVY